MKSYIELLPVIAVCSTNVNAGGFCSGKEELKDIVKTAFGVLTDGEKSALTQKENGGKKISDIDTKFTALDNDSKIIEDLKGKGEDGKVTSIDFESDDFKKVCQGDDVSLAFIGLAIEGYQLAAKSSADKEGEIKNMVTALSPIFSKIGVDLNKVVDDAKKGGSAEEIFSKTIEDNKVKGYLYVKAGTELKNIFTITNLAKLFLSKNFPVFEGFKAVSSGPLSSFTMTALNGLANDKNVVDQIKSSGVISDDKNDGKTKKDAVLVYDEKKIYLYVKE